MEKELEAQGFLLNVTFDGAPAVLQVRLFIHGGKVIGVRQCRLREHIDPPGLDCVGDPIPTFIDGKVTFEVPE